MRRLWKVLLRPGAKRKEEAMYKLMGEHFSLEAMREVSFALGFFLGYTLGYVLCVACVSLLLFAFARGVAIETEEEVNEGTREFDCFSCSLPQKDVDR